MKKLPHVEITVRKFLLLSQRVSMLSYCRANTVTI